MATTEKALRESIIAHGATVAAAGPGGALVGDISARFEDSLLITPSGANYAGLRRR
jgi:ribulose-5-phosphate 4-epimerase/fuculose-1-phosphate aldolase